MASNGQIVVIAPFPIGYIGSVSIRLRRAIWPTVLAMKQIVRTWTPGAIALLAVLLFAGALAAVSTTDAADDFGRGQGRPGYIYSGTASELAVVSDGLDGPAALDIASTFLGNSERFIESIEPINSRTAFVGVCCDPIEGRQLLVDLVDGSVEFFPFTVRFPSAGENGARYVAGGSTVSPNNLGAVLAYENGVGVVPPGVDLRERTDGVPFRPVILPDGRLSFVDVIDGRDVLVVTNEQGNPLAQSNIDEVRLIDYDERGDVVVALVGTQTIVMLDAESLIELSRSELDVAVSSIDVRDGWVLLVGSDGSLRAAPVENPTESEVLVDGDVDVAAWLRRPMSR